MLETLELLHNTVKDFERKCGHLTSTTLDQKNRVSLNTRCCFLLSLCSRNSF